jgi:hypothetical protein
VGHNAAAAAAADFVSAFPTVRERETGCCPDNTVGKTLFS